MVTWALLQILDNTVPNNKVCTMCYKHFRPHNKGLWKPFATHVKTCKGTQHIKKKKKVTA